MKFTVIIIAFVLIIMLLTLISAYFLTKKTGRQRLMGGIVILNIFIGWVLARDDSWLHHYDKNSEFIVTAAIILLMIELLTTIFSFVGEIFGSLAAKFLNVPLDMSKRKFLLKGFYPLAGIAAGLYGGLYERNKVIENNYDVAATDFKEVSGLKIAQLSDIHLGMFFTVSDLENLLLKVKQQNPDLVVITGDMLDDNDQNAAAISLLDKFAADFTHGIYYILGNHEYYRGAAAIKEMLSATKIHALYNSNEQIGDLPLFIAGTEYPPRRDKEGWEEDKQKYTEMAMKGILPAKTILLAHHPEFIDNAAALGVPLTLTGHTHGGQFCLLGMPLFPVFKYNKGLIKIGNSIGYVHSGNGSWFPFRLGCPPEIAYFTLKGK